MSAWNCISSSFTTMPPSTRSSLSLMRAVLLHRGEHIARLIRRRFERGPSDVRAVGIAREAGDDAASAILPVRRVQAGERGDDVDVAIVRDARRERFDVAALRDDAEVVAQPLHERAGNRDRAFERVVRRLRAELIRNRRDRARPPTTPASCRCSSTGSSRCRTCSSLRRAGSRSARPAPPADRRECRRWARRCSGPVAISP